jgi:hypothetical protein
VEGGARESAGTMHGELALWLLSSAVFVLAEIGLIVSRELWLPLLVAASILDRVAGTGEAASVDGCVGPARGGSAGVASISIAGNKRKGEGNRGMI